MFFQQLYLQDNNCDVFSPNQSHLAHPAPTCGSSNLCKKPILKAYNPFHMEGAMSNVADGRHEKSNLPQSGEDEQSNRRVTIGQTDTKEIPAQCEVPPTRSDHSYASLNPFADDTIGMNYSIVPAAPVYNITYQYGEPNSWAPERPKDAGKGTIPKSSGDQGQNGSKQNPQGGNPFWTHTSGGGTNPSQTGGLGHDGPGDSSQNIQNRKKRPSEHQ